MGKTPGHVLQAIGYFVGSNPEKPGRKRHPAPFEARQTFQRQVKNVSGMILRFVPIANAPRNISINPLEVCLVEIGKPPAVPLRRLDQRALARVTGVALRRGASLQPPSDARAGLTSRAAERAYKDADRPDTSASIYRNRSAPKRLRRRSVCSPGKAEDEGEGPVTAPRAIQDSALAGMNAELDQLPHLFL